MGNVKENVIGVLSAILLIAVMIGNTVFTAFTGRPMTETAAAGIQGERVQLPVLMYHHMLKEESRHGSYVVSPEEFERDLIYIKEKKYTTVTLKQVEEYVTLGTPLPEKPILITFDDGYESTYAYAFPLLKKYNMTAVISIIGKYTDLYSGDVTKSVSYAHANWEELKEMQDSGVFEVGNHTYELHQVSNRKGIRKLESETDEQYRQLLFSDIGSLNNEIEQELGTQAMVFAYPFGAFSKTTDDILKEMGFQVVLTCEEKVNTLSAGMCPNGELIRLRRFNRPSGLSSERMFAKWENK
jgi:peptidoglycan/xylan/chitin deacetylase (PgdA/CDA1 family)